MTAATDTEIAGRTVGHLLVLVPLSWGLIKCAAIARRPTTSTRCVASLFILLSSWLIVALVISGSDGIGMGRGLGITMGFVSLGLTVAAIVVAIFGLVDYGRIPGRYVQGWSQAVWTLVLAGVVLCGATVRLFSPRQGPVPLATQVSPGTDLIFTDLNFKFTAPGRPWARADFAKLSPYARLGFMRGDPEVFFAVSAEQTVPELNSETFASMGISRMKGTTDSVRVVRQTPARLGALDGVEVEVEAFLRGYHVCYLQWYGVTNGWAYQLAGWGRIENRESVMAECRSIMKGFQLLDYRRQPPLMGPGIGSDFVSKDFHYRVRCGTPEWLAWSALDKECAYASFGTLNRDDTALIVSAVWLMDLDPRPETIQRGLLGLTSLEEPADALAAAQPVHEGGLEGITTTFNHVAANGREFTYRVKILHGGGFAWLVSAWTKADQPGKELALSKAVSLVEFTATTNAQPDPATWNERTRRVHRMAFNSLGVLFHREGGYAEAARLFENAVALGTPPGTPYLANLADALMNAGRMRDALAALEAHSEGVAAQPALQAQRAMLQGRLGQDSAAITNYAKLFSSGFTSEEYFRHYIALLTQDNQPDRAMTEIEAYLKKQDVPGIRLLQTGLLKQRKRYDDAIAILKSQREKYRYHAGIAYALGDACIQAGRPTEALALSEELIHQSGATMTTLFLKGRAQFALKWYREAKESFELAQKESPTDPDVKSFLEAISGVLGEGANATVREPIPPVDLPPELAAAPAPAAAGYGQDEGAYYPRWVTAVSFEKGKELKQTEYVNVKTLNAAGVSAFSTFQIAFNPLNEELYVNRVEVRDAAGSLVSTGRVADSYVLDERSSGSASSHKVLNIPVSGLQPGCALELVCTRRELGKASEFTFLPFVFSKGVPVEECAFYLTGDTGAVRFASSPPLEPQTLNHGLCWRVKNPPVVRWEPLLPSTLDYVPLLWVADGSATWPELVTNYLASIRDRTELPATEKELARSLTAGATNLAQKVAAIAGYIQTNYTYKAIEFGRRARAPQPLADIVRNKYGDCKDHSVLAQQMLQAAGVSASLALVSFNAPGRRDLPSLDQFDHMLVHIPAPVGELFLDCTSKNADLAAPWTVGLAGRDALVLDAARPRFARIPDYPTNASDIRATRIVELTNRTDALVREEIVFSGVHAGYLRDYLRILLPAGRRTYVASQLLGGIGQLTDLAFEGLEQPSSPLAMKISYVARGQFQSLDDRIVGTPPMQLEKAFLASEPVTRRASPFEVAIPLTIEGSVTVNLPAQFKPKPLAASSASAAGEFITCRTSAAVIERGWRMDYTVYRPATRRPAADYVGYCDAVQHAVEMLAPNLIGEQVRP